MKRTTLGLLCLLLPLSAVMAQAQVYETTDEDGNASFSDVPQTDDSKPIELESSNIADSVEVRPPEPDEAPTAEKPAQPRRAEETPPGYVDGNDDLLEDDYEERRRRKLKEHVSGRERPVTRPAPVHRPAPHAGPR